MIASNTKDALILAAGMGSRLSAEEGHKLLAKVGGVALLDHHLDGLSRLGVDRLTIVTGHANTELEERLSSWNSPIEITTTFNPEYRKSNGISVLCGAKKIREFGADAFWLLMSDHLFEPTLFETLQNSTDQLDHAAGVLAVDSKLETIYDMPDATKVHLESQDSGMLAIGKELDEFNWVDAGLFWCGPEFTGALESELADRGDCSTSDAVRRLNAQKRMYFWDIGPHEWQDVDTPGARAHAEGLLKKWSNS